MAACVESVAELDAEASIRSRQDVSTSAKSGHDAIGVKIDELLRQQTETRAGAEQGRG